MQACAHTQDIGSCTNSPNNSTIVASGRFLCYGVSVARLVGDTAESTVRYIELVNNSLWKFADTRFKNLVRTLSPATIREMRKASDS